MRATSVIYWNKVSAKTFKQIKLFIKISANNRSYFKIYTILQNQQKMYSSVINRIILTFHLKKNQSV